MSLIKVTIQLAGFRVGAHRKTGLALFELRSKDNFTREEKKIGKG